MKAWINLTLLSLGILFGQSNNALANSKKEIEAHFKQNIVGNEYYTKVSVIKVAGGIKGTDASNVYQSGDVLHRTGMFLVTPDPEYFIKEMGRKIGGGKADFITHIEPGTKIHIHDVEVKSQEIQIEFTARFGYVHGKTSSKGFVQAESLGDLTRWSDLLGLPPQTLRLKFNKDYSLDDAINTFGLAFSSNRADASVPIVLGMDKEEIITTHGVPEIHVQLDNKEIMVYKALKLILVDGKLVNAE
jgi:hypothetical protein